MTFRILGLHSVKGSEWDKIVYLHSNSVGSVCINGAPLRLALCHPGEDARGSDYVIIIPPSLETPLERYISISGGGCMLWVDPDGALSVRNSGFAGVSARLEVLRKMSVAVLTVSDKSSRGERADTAGPALADMAEALGAEVEERATLPDERLLIARKLEGWADSGKFQLILTTGGTGLSQRDVTPEAFMDVQEKIVPGFGEIMRSRSMLYTPRGFLTRSLAVIRGGALIISFPGSERAVRQCFEAVASSVRHAVEILNGWDAECGGYHHGEGGR
ncbi:MAG: MogA/MoaB family molybdenum cofactor biosynthesis protein [Synergistaceae bacterium]|jgi:molybdenum cofactor synthesis domain-containing protein|nr:MogA/MoaB family molybdenum cofactor biosynthesis protein [Synergistaceae bacterium]